MKLKEIYNSKKPVISFEIFPPKAEEYELKEKIDELFEELKKLSKYSPSFISVTYGAGGSTREKTLELVLRIQKELNIAPMPHFTCVGSTKSEILHYLKIIQDAKIENILALRGDPPKGAAEFKKVENGFGYANELVEFIKLSTDLSVAVAGYPEGHQECESLESDIINLKRKVDTGAEIILTQLFFDNKYFLDFLERAQKAGINVPIVPGILPVTGLSQIERVITFSSSKIPDHLRSLLGKYEGNPADMKKAGLEYVTQQCRELINIVPGFHFYTFNKSAAISSILNNLDLKEEFDNSSLI